MQKRFIDGALGTSLLFAIIAMALLVAWFLVTQERSTEASIAHFEREQEAFVQQIQQNPGTFVENAGTPIFDNHIVQASPVRVVPETVPRVLGTDAISEEEKKWIEIDLSELQLTTWAGETKVKDYPVSTGLPGTPTVKGEFRVWRKVLSQGYRGGSKENGTYYYLPNVPYSLFFHKGYAIHAAYWHNDFGIRPRSHGCVNMRTEDAKEVYEWANPVMPIGFTAFNAEETNPGTRIVIHD